MGPIHSYSSRAFVLSVAEWVVIVSVGVGGKRSELEGLMEGVMHPLVGEDRTGHYSNPVEAEEMRSSLVASSEGAEMLLRSAQNKLVEARRTVLIPCRRSCNVCQPCHTRRLPARLRGK